MRRLELALCLLAFGFPALAQTPKLVIVVSLHGIRAPLDSMTQYTRTPWPDLQTSWGVRNLGDLTPHGQDTITLLGAYYRAYYVADGLLSAADCPGNQIYFRADTTERTQHTAIPVDSNSAETFELEYANNIDMTCITRRNRCARCATQ